jgi:flagellar assembly factor FliW
MLMELTQSVVGPLQVEETSVIEFPEGILGFSSLRQFVLVEYENSDPFKWLQCLSDPELALPVVDPLRIFPDYSDSPAAEDLASVQAESAADVVTFVVAIIPKDPLESTVNLKAPVIVNFKKMIGRQIILESSREVRTRIIAK